MTTHEWLYEAGLLDDFDAAARRRDRTSMVHLLNRVGLADQAGSMAESILAHPAHCGF